MKKVSRQRKHVRRSSVYLRNRKTRAVARVRELGELVLRKIQDSTGARSLRAFETMIKSVNFPKGQF